MLDTPKNRRLIVSCFLLITFGSSLLIPFSLLLLQDLSADDILHLKDHEHHFTRDVVTSLWCKTLTMTNEFDRTYICKFANDSSRPKQSPGFICTCSMDLVEYDMSEKDDHTGPGCYPTELNPEDGEEFKVHCTPAASPHEMNCQRSNKNVSVFYCICITQH